MKKRLIILAGGLLSIGIAVLFYPFVSMTHSSHITKSLSNQANSKFASYSDSVSSRYLYRNADEPKDTTKTYKTGFYPEPAPTLSMKAAKGAIIGKLSIPSLHIEEAILEGTDQPELAKAPGHLTDSVLPGQVGKSVIAAHNATTFRDIDKLTPGSTFSITTVQGEFTFSVIGHQILHVKDKLPDAAYPAVSLETCYPLDVLHLTDKRLFVEAALIKSEFGPKK